MLKIILLLLALLLTACNSNPKQNLNGKKLIQVKCASCHNLDLPPKTFEDEKAPPMMAVSFHIVNFIQAHDESIKITKAIEFVKDYVIHPSTKKSFCDKKSLQSYGLMPSQEGKVTIDELDAIAHYMFSHFTQKKLDEAQQELNAFNKLSNGEKIALKNKCLSCHRVDKDIVGPSFQKIANKYIKEPKHISKTILNGSKNIWPNFRGAMMPAFKKLSQKDIKILTDWIIEQK